MQPQEGQAARKAAQVQRAVHCRCSVAVALGCSLALLANTRSSHSAGSGQSESLHQGVPSSMALWLMNGNGELARRVCCFACHALDGCVPCLIPITGQGILQVQAHAHAQCCALVS